MNFRISLSSVLFLISSVLLLQEDLAIVNAATIISTPGGSLVTPGVARRDLYFDSNSAIANANGDKTRPYSNLLSLINMLKVGFITKTQVNVYLKPSPKAYSVKTDPSTIINNTFIAGIVFLPWDSQIVQSDSDCDLLPRINGTDFYLTLASIPSVSFTGIKFIQMSGSIQVQESQQVVMSDLCIDDEASMSNKFFVIKDTDSFTLQRTIVTIANGTEIISYSNTRSGPKNVAIESLTLNFLDNSNKITLEAQTESYFRFNSALAPFTKRNSIQNLKMNNISFQSKGSVQVLSEIFEITGWQNVSVSGLNLTDQAFHISRNGVFDFKKITLLTLQNILVSGSAVYSQVLSDSKEKISFFNLKNVESLDFSDTLIFDNFLNGTSSLENNFRFLQIDGITRLTVNNISATSNECNILTYIIRIKTQSTDNAISMDFSDIKIDSNNATDNIFYLLKFSEAKIGAFSAKNITVTNNRFSSRIFDIYTVADAGKNGQHLSDVVVSHIPLNLTDISILNNDNLLNFGLLIVFVGNPPSLPPDYVPDYEYYSVLMDNLTIENNNFIKGQDTDLTDQLSVIEITGAQLYIHNSRVANSSFVSFDFVSLYRELSSVFFVNSTVSHTNFTEAHFIITRYEALMVTKGSFFNISSSNREVQAIYRYSFILDSNFTDMKISGGSLFTFRNAFLLLSQNNFDSITFINSLLLNAGKFRPPGNDLFNITFGRNLKVEKESLERLNPTLLETYNFVAESLQGLYPDTIYWYALRANNMTKLRTYTPTLFNFEDYHSQQSFICVTLNNFLDVEVPDVSTDIFKLSGALQAFSFLNNTMDGLDGDGSVLRLSALEENKYFEFNNNTIQNTQGPSILVATATEISILVIAYNQILDNSFSNTLFMIDTILHNGNIVFVENNFINNVLAVDNGDLNTMNAFLEVSSEASNTEALFIFDKCVFINNKLINSRKFNQYSQLNAMINLLLANSSLIISNTVFQDTQVVSKGSDMFYIAAEYVLVINCKFNGTSISGGHSVFNLLSWNIAFKNNEFDNTNIPVGKGLIFLSPYPYLEEAITVQMTSNWLKNVTVRKNSAHVLYIENSNLNLMAAHNIFIDTFSLSPLFYFSNTTFIDSSYISNSTLKVSDQGEDENLMYKASASSGNLKISDNVIHYYKQDDDPDTLFKAEESPDLNVTISNLTWSPDSEKSTARLADIDSGNVLITDTVLEDFVYPVTTSGEGLLINVGSTKTKAFNLNLTLQNVIFRNMSFTIPAKLEKSTVGLIGLVGSENILSEGDSTRPWMFRLENCSFISINNVAAVYVNMHMLFDIVVSHTLFDSLFARFGPAFDFFTQSNKDSKIAIVDSTFSNNRALKAGGSIYLADSHYDIRDNIFVNNSAGDLGGSIILQNRQRTDLILAQNTFINNSATVGENIASLPTKFITSFIFQNGTSLQANGSTLQNSHNQTVSIRNISRVALNVSLIDNDGQVTLDTSNTAKRMAIITFADQPSITTFNCTKGGCYINSLNTTLTGDFRQIKAVDVQFSSDVSDLYFQKRFSVVVSPCLEGEHFNPYTKTCDYCGLGTYSLSADESCQKCPENAYCPGGSVLMPLKGYWRSLASTQTSPEIFQCRKDGVSRCSSSLDLYGDFIESQCEPGYEGVKCEACALDEGYVESGLLQCKKCSNVIASFVFTIISTLGFALTKLYCILRLYRDNQSLCSATDPEAVKKESSESTYYVRLLLIYTQILSIIYLFHMEVREVIGSYAHIGNPTEFILLKLECSMMFLGIPPNHYIYASVMFLFLSPIVQLFTVIIIAKLFIKKRSESTKFFARLCVIYIIISEQPGIVGFMTGFLSCEQDDPYSSPYVGLHPNTKCDSEQYYIIRYFIVIPCLVVWAGLIPLWAFFSLFLKRNKLNSLSVRLPWGNLYNIYKTRYYWWGTVSMLLGVTLSFITYYFQGDLKSCLALVFILLWIYQIAVRHLKPYKLDSWNKMEATTVGLLILNLMLAYFTLSSPVEQLKMVAYGALILINGAMVSYIIYKIVSKRVVTFVDRAIRKLTFKKSSKRKKSDGPKKLLLQDDRFSIRSESCDSLSSSYSSFPNSQNSPSYNIL